MLSYRAPLFAVTALFFIWGFLTALNDILIPHLKAVFDLNYAEAMLIQFTFFGAYFVMSIPSGWLVAKLGYQWGIVLGLVTAGCGALLFYPSASLLWYPLFLAALFVLASGITLLQVAANPYVAVLGTPETASSRLTLTQAFNSLGTTVAPYIGGLLILGGVLPDAHPTDPAAIEALQAARLEQAASVQMPYLAIAGTLMLFAALMALLRLPVIASVEDHTAEPASVFDALGHSQLALGALAIFCYVGAEVSIGSFLINYLGEPNIGGLEVYSAAAYVGYYWGGAMIGRFLGSALLRLVNPGLLLGLFAAAAGALVTTSAFSDGTLAMWAILSVGLFNSIMFPTIFTLGIDGLGRLTSQGSSILVMAIIGGAIIPLVSGHLADAFGIQRALLLAVACYLYIVFYGLAGARHR